MMNGSMNREVREIQSRTQWLDWRKSDLTASAIGVLFDEHKFVSREQLVAEKRGLGTRGDRPAMRDGRILEPAVAAAIAEDNPDWEITKANTYHRIPELRLAATPDYWLDTTALIQVKTVSPEEWQKWHGKPPLFYTLQTLTELLVTERERGVLAVMIRQPGYPLHLFEVPRHEAAERRIIDAVTAWWQAFDNGEVPEGVPSREIAADVDDGTHRDFTGDNYLSALLDERYRLKAQASAAEKRLEVIDAEIKERIGVARTAWLPGWFLQYPTIHAKEYTVPARDYRRLDIRKEESNVS